MKRKIHSNIAILSVLVALLVAVFLILTFYNFHVASEIKSLRDYGNIISQMISPLDKISIEPSNNDINSNIRITIIDLNGGILFDSVAESQSMENHLDRPEVRDALELGEGEAVRKSSTLDKDSYYYATLLSNKSILRISRQGDTIYSHFINILPSIFLIIFLILVLSFISSYLLSKRILEPVESAAKNMEVKRNNKDSDRAELYDEIIPFIKKVESQEQQIKDNIEVLEERAALMNVISSSMEEGLILLDKNKKILSTNASGIKLLEGDQALSYQGEDFIRLSRNIKLSEALDRSIEKKSSEELIVHEESNYVNIYVNPVLANNRLVGLVILILDYTKKHEIDIMRKEFSANVSHELKTPLTSINGYAEMIENGMVKEEDIKKFAATIRKEGSRLLELIDSIIKLSKIEEEEAENFAPVDLYEIGKSTVGSLELLAARKNIDLKLEGETSLINGNKSMIEELIYNLLDNAIRYTDSASSIHLSIESQDGWAYIKVKDRGIGIGEGDQYRIFERFYTVDKSRSKKPESTGIGLSIVKHIVEKHHGKIELVSEIGEGTEIIVRIELI